MSAQVERRRQAILEQMYTSHCVCQDRNCLQSGGALRGHRL